MPLSSLFHKSIFAVGLAGLMTGVAAETALTEPVAKQPHQVPGYYRMNIAGLEITALYDGYVQFDPAWLKGINREDLQNRLNNMFVDTDNGIQTAVNGYLINTGNNLVLVDTGAAGCFGSTMGSLGKNLQASGYTPEQVDTVLLTHLHPDHSCGLANADGTPAFPKATVYIPQTEASFWLDTAMDKIPEADKPFFNMARTAVAPYTEGKIQRYQPADELLPGVESIAAYGHTPGHTAYLFRSGTKNLIVWGDIVHNHAVQFAQPEVVIEADADTEQARTTRLQLLSNSSAEKFWVAGAHLPFPGLGHVSIKEGAYSWIPTEFSPVMNDLESSGR